MRNAATNPSRFVKQSTLVEQLDLSNPKAPDEIIKLLDKTATRSQPKDRQ